MCVFRLLYGKGDILGEFTEIESGIKSDKHRPQLLRALQLCRKDSATLVVARLDRLSRSVAFIHSLMDSGVDFIVGDLPLANRFTIHVIAAFAEYEHKLISERQRAARAVAKGRGVRVGWAIPPSLADIRKGHESHRRRLNAFAADMKPIISQIRAAGIQSRYAIANILNLRDIPSPHGRKWHAETVKLVEKRADMVVLECRDWIETLARKNAELAREEIQRSRRKGARSYDAIARDLNSRGVMSPRGGRWYGRLVSFWENKAARWTISEHPHLSKRTRVQLERILAVVTELRVQGATPGYAEIADALNFRGIDAPGRLHRQWTYNQVWALLCQIAW